MIIFYALMLSIRSIHRIPVRLLLAVNRLDLIVAVVLMLLHVINHKQHAVHCSEQKNHKK